MRLGRVEREIYNLSLILFITVPLFYYLTSPTDDIKSMKRTSTHEQKVKSPQVTPVKEEAKQEILEEPVALKPDTDFLLKSDLKTSTVLRLTQHGLARDDEGCKSDNTFMYVDFNSPAGLIPVFVHPAQKSRASSVVISGSVWEEETVEKLYNLVKEHPDMQFIDIGANVGSYGLTMAKLGRKVLMIEPLLTNVKMLCMSVREGNYHDAYILHNAVSSKRGTVAVVNLKDGVVDDASIRSVGSRDEETAYAFILDDLLGTFKFTTVAIKLDIGGQEHDVFKAADKFFSKVDVRYVVVEWGKDKRDDNKGAHIIKFLTRHNMEPYDPLTEQVLTVQKYYRWIRPVLWIKSKK